MNPLSLHIRRSPVMSVEVSGDLCISSTPIFEPCMLRLVSLCGEARLILDLRRVAFCDVTALRCLWRLQAAARTRGVELAVRRSPAITRLERLVERQSIARVA